MLRRVARFAPIAFLTASASAAACSSSSPSEAVSDAGALDAGSDTFVPVCAAYTVPAGTDLTTPSVSFRNDVLPIMAVTCALSNCHGFPGAPQTEGLVLGVADGGLTDDDAGDAGGSPTPGTPSAIIANVVGVTSKELSQMKRVTAGDPAKSYLMHKVDGDHCLFDAQCTDGDCGKQMPQSSDALSETSRLVIRRWITQGALDN